jgi:hypothetical protein
MSVSQSWARAGTGHRLGTHWAHTGHALGTHWAHTRHGLGTGTGGLGTAWAGWARERGTTRAEWARAGTGGLGTNWAQAG